jgi:hypothetical protein
LSVELAAAQIPLAKFVGQIPPRALGISLQGQTGSYIGKIQSDGNVAWHKTAFRSFLG